MHTHAVLFRSHPLFPSQSIAIWADFPHLTDSLIARRLPLGRPRRKLRPRLPQRADAEAADETAPAPHLPEQPGLGRQ